MSDALGRIYEERDELEGGAGREFEREFSRIITLSGYSDVRVQPLLD
jgi:hypothetical protein